MLPDNVISTLSLSAAFIPPRNVRKQLLLDYARGGVAIGDASQGLDVKDWRCRLVGADVVVGSDDVPETTIFTQSDITELSLTFDQNMRPFIAFVAADQASYRWYDSVVSSFVISNLPANSMRPRCAMDDVRPSQSSSSDIILAYTRDNVLYYRQQRDRYLVEYALSTGVVDPLHQVGMSVKNRFQFKFEVNI